MVTFGPDLTLEQAIQQAVGAASMCWATPEGAGIFQEDRARAIADDLLAGLREGRWTETPSGRPETIKDSAEHPDHPHGSTVEQVHRILGQAYADEPDRWMLAEELVKFVTKQVAQGTTAADDAFLAELVQAFARPLTPEDLSAPTDRLSIVESLIRAGRLKAGRPSTIPEHLAEAERLLAFAFIDNDPESAPGGYYVDDDHCNTQVAAAEVHARIAHAAAAAGMLRPVREEPENPEDRPGYVLLERLVLVLDRLALALEPPSPTSGEHDGD